MIIDSLLVALGFDVDKEGIAEFEKRVEEARDTVLSMVAAAGAAAAAVGAFVTTVAGRVDELGDFADRNEVAIEALQELGHAAQMEGSGIEALMSSIEGLNKVTGEAVLGIGRGAKTFETLGFKARDARGKVKSVDQMLEEVSERMKTMSRQEALGMAGKLGIDASLVPLLQKGAERMRELREEARAFGVASDEDAKKAGALSDELDRMKFLAQSLGVKLATELMPIVTRIFERFKDWYLQNKEIIQQRLQVALAIITTALGVLWDVVWGTVSAVSDLVAWLSKFKAVTYLATAALAAFVAVKTGQFFQSVALLALRAAGGMMAFNFAALLIPMAIGAVILALGLLIEDFMVFRRGGESVIGDLVKKFPELAGVIEAIGSTVDSVVAWFKAQWATLAGPLAESGGHLMKLAGILMSVLWPVAKFVFGMIGRVISFLLPIIVSVVGWVLELAVLMAGGLVEAFNIAATAIEFVADKISAFIDGVKDAIDWVARLLGLSGGTTELEVKKTEKGASVATGQQANPAERAPIALAQPPMLEMISQSPAMTGQQQAPAGFGPRAPAGTMGAVNTSTVQNTTTNLTTNVAKIEIVSTDPAKAGESVKRELDRTNKTGIRNGQAGYL